MSITERALGSGVASGQRIDVPEVHANDGQSDPNGITYDSEYTNYDYDNRR